MIEAPRRPSMAAPGRDVDPEPRPSEGAPVGTPEAGRSSSRRTAGRVITLVGLALVLFIGFEVFVSALVESRSQHQALSAFKQVARTSRAGAVAAPAPGDPVALLSIPGLGLTQVVTEGVTSGDLQRGPGHLPGTALPGEVGNAVIAARRATFGGPFRRVDRLHPGDVVWCTTPQGSFRYVVTEVGVVRPGRADVLAPTAEATLTLVTASPPYLASSRLVATAKLDGVPLPAARLQPFAPGGEDVALSGDASALPLALLWLQLLAITVFAAWRLYRWRPQARRATYLLTTPVIVALLGLLFLAVDRLLPATL